jgi:hypothetical protein
MTQILLCALLVLWLHRFTKKWLFYLPVLVALLLFGIGFCLRMSGVQVWVDFGFFCTESSALFLTALFVAALILGQQRYWEMH